MSDEMEQERKRFEIKRRRGYLERQSKALTEALKESASDPDGGAKRLREVLGIRECLRTDDSGPESGGAA